MIVVATPPNAIVFASGYLTIPQVAKAGLWMNFIGVADLLILLAAWGECADCTAGNCPADLTGSCTVGVADLLILLANWG